MVERRRRNGAHGVADFISRQLAPREDCQYVDDQTASRASVVTAAALRDVRQKSLVLDSSRRERSREVVRALAKQRVLSDVASRRVSHAKRRAALRQALSACEYADFEPTRQAWLRRFDALSADRAKSGLKNINSFSSGASAGSPDASAVSSPVLELSLSSTSNLQTSDSAPSSKPTTSSATSTSVGTSRKAVRDHKASWESLGKCQEIRTDVLRSVGLLGAEVQVLVKNGKPLAKPFCGTVVHMGSGAFHIVKKGPRSCKSVQCVAFRRSQLKFVSPLDGLGTFWADGLAVPPRSLEE